MTKEVEGAIDILNLIIEEGWLISDLDKCKAIDACKLAINALKQESKWIPVGEELPIKSDYYLATIKESSGEKVVRSVWYDGEWKIASVVQNVIAWQPLPDYYREESEAIE